MVAGRGPQAVHGGEKRMEPAEGFLVLETTFVTGVTGFVGSNLARRLLEEGLLVRALVRRGSDASSLEGLDIERVEGDLLDEEFLARALSGCLWCFHLAAAYSSPDPGGIYRINVAGTEAVLRAAARAGCRALVHTSTVGTIGRSDASGNTPPREDDSYLPETASDYVKSKFQSEQAALRLAAEGAPVVVAHLSAPVGPWDRGPTVTGRRIVAVLRRRHPFYVRGAINHVSVKDVAQGLVLAARKGVPGRRYLLARVGGNLKRSEFTRMVARAAGIRPPRARWIPALLGRLRSGREVPRSLACDPSRSVRELGLPQTPLEDAFAEAVRWFRDRGYDRP
jgi:dihydroflavonol-4-reductase